MTPAEMRAWVIRMLRRGRGEQFEPETPEPPISTRDQHAKTPKPGTTRRKSQTRSRNQSKTR